MTLDRHVAAYRDFLVGERGDLGLHLREQRPKRLTCLVAADRMSARGKHFQVRREETEERRAIAVVERCAEGGDGGTQLCFASRCLGARTAEARGKYEGGDRNDPHGKRSC